MRGVSGPYLVPVECTWLLGYPRDPQDTCRLVGAFWRGRSPLVRRRRRTDRDPRIPPWNKPPFQYSRYPIDRVRVFWVRQVVLSYVVNWARMLVVVDYSLLEQSSIKYYLQVIINAVLKWQLEDLNSKISTMCNEKVDKKSRLNVIRMSTFR